MVPWIKYRFSCLKPSPKQSFREFNKKKCGFEKILALLDYSLNNPYNYLTQPLWRLRGLLYTDTGIQAMESYVMIHLVMD